MAKNGSPLPSDGARVNKSEQLSVTRSATRALSSTFVIGHQLSEHLVDEALKPGRDTTVDRSVLAQVVENLAPLFLARRILVWSVIHQGAERPEVPAASGSCKVNLDDAPTIRGAAI